MAVLLVILFLAGFLFPPIWILFVIALIVAVCRPKKVVLVEPYTNRPLAPQTGAPAKDPRIPFALYLAFIFAIIPCLPHDPKFPGVYDAEIVGDGASKFAPSLGYVLA